MKATGGVITQINGYRIHTFTAVGNDTFVVTKEGVVDVLIVGGGGGGGHTTNSGGGGAGGVLYATSISVYPSTYKIVIGDGGAAHTVGNPTSISFYSTIALGGGAGGDGDNNGGNGASGGGAGCAGSSKTGGTGTQGYNGGNTTGNWYCAGGGGAGGASANVTTTADTAAGIGVAYDISGASVTYGRGGRVNYDTAGNNTGNGGSSRQTGGDSGHPEYVKGGSGIVIIRYRYGINLLNTVNRLCLSGVSTTNMLNAEGNDLGTSYLIKRRDRFQYKPISKSGNAVMPSDPVGWSRKFITVGASGKDYTTLSGAVTAASAGDILLCYGTGLGAASISKRLFIRGVGASPADTEVAALSPTSCPYLLVENLSMVAVGDWGVCIGLYGASLIYLNKCYLNATNSNGMCIASRSAVGQLYVRNVYLNRGTGYAHLSRTSNPYLIYLDYIYLQKSQTNGAITYGAGATNALAESDNVTTPTANYGYAYGTNIITDAFLARYGY